MPRRQFASEKAIQNHAELTDNFYAFEGAATFAKWRALLSPDKYEIVDVRTSQGCPLYSDAGLGRRFQSCPQAGAAADAGEWRRHCG
jgi:hypothetical protein